MSLWKRRDVRNSTRPAAHPAACAIITRDFLSHARALADSYYAHYPDGRFYLLTLDGLPAGSGVDSRAHILSPNDVLCPYFWEMAVRYDAFQLSCALKPFLVETLFDSFQEERIFYLDSDMLIFRRLAEAEQMLAHADMVITPHVLEPIAPDGHQPDELYILSGGVYNMGFFAIRNAAQSRRLLEWWSTRLRTGAGIDLAAGMYLDQRWADFFPSLFPSVAILRDRTYNVAFWNLHERHLRGSPNGFEVDGHPLSLFHFSGVDLDELAFKPTHQDRIVVAPGSPLAALLKDYAARTAAHGREECRAWGNGFNTFENGMAFHPSLKQLYLGLEESHRVSFGNPFCTSRADCFLEWAVRPAPRLSPFLRQVYSEHADVRHRFPDVEGTHYAPFLEWALTEGANTLGFSPLLVHAPSGGVTNSYDAAR